MPEKVLIDNYEHAFAHIHTDRKEIKTQNLNDTRNIVLNQIKKYHGLNMDKLRKEVKNDCHIIKNRKSKRGHPSFMRKISLKRSINEGIRKYK